MSKKIIHQILCCLMLTFTVTSQTEASNQSTVCSCQKIPFNPQSERVLHKGFPIVRCPFKPSKYESILLTKLRDKNTSKPEFRAVAHKMGEILIQKVVECLATEQVEIETPLIKCIGEMLATPIELVSIMRSGDALLEPFISHFPDANVSKILVQRDEETARPVFKYMKLSPTISQDHPVIITEPMIATGGTLGMVIQLLKDQGVKEKNIIIACMFAAPEGLMQLSEQFPEINVVLNVLDEKLNEKKYIVPGLGDFGDRYFGTN
jgi:uracil phosphoribosyltransferase